MNKTIEKIVGLLFEDLEDSEEVRAIHEEICQNCQERYEDKLALGLSEDEAIHAVVESLSGMEEMLRAYPRHAPQAQAEPETEWKEADEVLHHFAFDPAVTPVREISAMRLGCTDVKLIASRDGLIHIDCEEDTPDVRLQEGVLLIASQQTDRDSSAKWKADINTGNASLNSMLGNLLGGLMRSFSASFGGGQITIAIPNALRPVVKIGTASGDLEAGALRLEELHFSTASGDLDLTDLGLRTLRCSSTSGDLSLNHLSAEQLSLTSTSGDLHAEGMQISGDTHINTTSGDVHWAGDSGLMEINTISGDICRLTGAMNVLRFKTVSGDVGMTLNAERLAALNGKTTSGDMRLTLDGAPPLQLKCHTVSGDVRSQLATRPDSPVVVELTSVSGDLSVR